MKNKYLGNGEAGFHPIRKLTVTGSGLCYAMISDFSVLYKLAMALLAVVAINHAWVDAALILLATGIMLMAELFNTAIEALCDFVEVRHNEKIGIIKGIAAAGTGMAIFAWAIVMIGEAVTLWPRFLSS